MMIRVRLMLLSAINLCACVDPTPAPPNTPSGVPSAPSGSVAAPSCAASEFRGIPKKVSTSTVVDSECLEILGRDPVTVQPGASLIVIARRELKIDEGAFIGASGAQGAKGDAAKESEDLWVAQDPDRGEKIACTCQGRSCKSGWQPVCGVSGNAAIRGGKGKTGSSAGNVRIVAYRIVGANNLKIDLSGGPGGLPGESGTTHCTEGRPGGLECRSVRAPNGGDGDPGANGVAVYRAGPGFSSSAAADQALKALVNGTVLRSPLVPAPSTQIVETPASLKGALDDAVAAGQSYANVPGDPIP